MEGLTLGFFIAFTVLAGLLLLWTIRGIRRKTSARFGVIRFWCWLPFIIYGQAIYPLWSMDTLHPGYIFFGIWLPVWCLISSFMSRRCKKRDSMKDWGSSQQSRWAFYILCADTIILVFSIIEACRFPISRHPVWKFDDDLGKIMRVIMILILVSQGVLLIPMTRLPGPFEAIILLISRNRARRRKPYANLGSSHDLERLLPEMPEPSDLVNLSLASKSIRGSVFYPSPATSSSRIEFLCEASCEKSKKSQCWACERVICRRCRVSRQSIQYSRAADHIKHCYAICTKCYLLRSGARSAPFQAKWHSDDLSKQHFGCSLSRPAHTHHHIDLCTVCSRLDGAAVSALREERDAVSMRRALSRPIDCATCQKALNARHRRWWICDKGEHECHWFGHEINVDK